MDLPANLHTRECPYCHNKTQFNYIRNNNVDFMISFSARVNPEDEKSNSEANSIAVYKCCVCGGPLFVRAYGPQNLDIYP